MLRFFAERQRAGEPGPDVCDFTFGNPHEMPLPGLVDAIRRHAEPRAVDWFAYKTSEARPRELIAEALGRELGLRFEPEDIALTQGAFGAIALAFRLLLDVGDAAVIPAPGWFCYAPTLRAADLVPVRPRSTRRASISTSPPSKRRSGRARAWWWSTAPPTPRGASIPAARSSRLAELLDAASARIGARIWLLSDEPYRRIRFDGSGFVSPAAVYPWTLIDYSYGKVLLAPGQRLGYLALSPLMPARERATLRAALVPTQAALGWTFPDAVMQYAVRRSRGALHRHRRAPGQARPPARGADAVGLPRHPAGGHVLPLGHRAGRRRRRLRRAARGAGRLRDARHPLRPPWAFPPLPDRDRGDDRARPARLRGRGAVSVRPGAARARHAAGPPRGRRRGSGGSAPAAGARRGSGRSGATRASCR